MARIPNVADALARRTRSALAMKSEQEKKRKAKELLDEQMRKINERQAKRAQEKKPASDKSVSTGGGQKTDPYANDPFISRWEAAIAATDITAEINKYQKMIEARKKQLDKKRK